MLNPLDTLHLWLSQTCQFSIEKITPLAGDASFRQYFRIHGNFPNESSRQLMLMDARSPNENINQFIQIAKILKDMRINVPDIIKEAPHEGFLLLEDLGDDLLLSKLDDQSVDFFYTKAIDILLQIHAQPIPYQLPSFDIPHMLKEMQLFQDWFLEHHLNLQLSTTEQQLIQASFLKIARTVDSHPKSMIHRDFHSRNLMVLPNNDLGVIDFQDAMIGARAYDVVSLLKDCYISWDKKQQNKWSTYFYHGLNTDTDLNDFLKEFTLCGIQRHIKVLGIFSRLNYRDGKSKYLADLPLTWQYLTQALDDYPELVAFKDFIDSKVEPLFQSKLIPC